MISSHASLLSAYDNGRNHTQRFMKTGVGQTADGRWQDWAFQAGQPAYDARIGQVTSFVPVVASKNDAIYFPPCPAGMERCLHQITMRPLANGASQASVEFMLYDLVGYYPLIDGDSTDRQDMDNTQSLPRYTDGKGLQLVMVNHVSPATANGRMMLDYTDTNGNNKTLTTGVPLNGINTVCSGVRDFEAADTGPVTLSLEAAGVLRVNRVTYLTPPGGLHCIYVIKPLAQFVHFHDLLVQGLFEKHAIEIDFFTKDGGRLPRIKDGAHLSFFYRPNGSSRAVSMFGDATFIWG